MPSVVPVAVSTVASGRCASPKSTSFTRRLRHHGVGGLDVPMHDPARVRLGQGLRHLAGQLHGLLDRQRSPRQARLEGLAVAVRHREQELTGGKLLDVVDRADVGMIEERGGPRLVDQARFGGLVPSEVRRQQLQRHLPAEAQVLGQIDLAHGARADPLDEPVVARASSRPCRAPIAGRSPCLTGLTRARQRPRHLGGGARMFVWRRLCAVAEAGSRGGFEPGISWWPWAPGGRDAYLLGCFASGEGDSDGRREGHQAVEERRAG